jgi:hypothetical protein
LTDEIYTGYSRIHTDKTQPARSSSAIFSGKNVLRVSDDLAVAAAAATSPR